MSLSRLLASRKRFPDHSRQVGLAPSAPAARPQDAPRSGYSRFLSRARPAVAIVRNDVLRWISSPSALGAAILPPVGLAVLLYLLSISVGRQPVALVVQSHSHAAAVLARGFKADTDAYILHRLSMAQAQAELSDQLVAAIIKIPNGFTLATTHGHIDLILNNIDTDFSDDIRRSVTRTLALFDLTRGTMTDLDADDNTDGHPTVYPVYLNFHLLRKTNVPFVQYQLVSVLILIVINVGLLGSALLCAQDIESGSALLLVLSPASSVAIAAGKVIAGVIATWVLLIPVLILGALAGIISPPTAHWPWLLAVLFFTSLFAGGLGLLVGSALRGTRLVAMLSLNAATILFFLGGGFTTIAFLPPWVEHISRVVPTRYAIQAVGQTLFYPDLIGVTQALWILLASAIAAAALGSLAFIRATHSGPDGRGHLVSLFQAWRP